MKKLAFLDLETTSLDERTGDLWEIGLILRDFTKPEVTEEEFWWQVRPDLTHASPNSVLVGRYYERSRVIGAVGAGKRLGPFMRQPRDEIRWMHEFTGKPPAEGDYYLDENADRIAAQLARMLDKATIVANNPAFDRKFLEKFLRDNGQILTADHRMRNIRDLLIGYIDGRISCCRGLEVFGDAADLVAAWFEGETDNPSWEIVGVKQDPETVHTALGDARLVRDVYDAIRWWERR